MILINRHQPFKGNKYLEKFFLFKAGTVLYCTFIRKNGTHTHIKEKKKKI